MMVDPPLRTERLLIREYCQQDWRAVHSYGSDREVVRYMPWGPNTVDDTQAFMQRTIMAQADDPRYDFELAVILAETGELVGGCGLTVTNAAQREATLGYCFHRRAWGRGYATEASRAMLQFGFSMLALHRIWATCDPMNHASIRVLERSGMRREGYLVEHLWIHGEWRDSLLWAMVEREWEGMGMAANEPVPSGRERK